MKISFRLRGVFLAAGFSCLMNAGVSAAPATAIFNATSGLLSGWSSVVWGELTVEPSKAAARTDNGLSLVVTPTAVAVPYAGLQIVADGTGGIALPDTLRTGGEVRLYLRNGVDAAGKPAADQMLQVMLAFRPEGGKVLNGQYEPVVLEPSPADGKATAGWQLVKLSIAKHLKGRVDAATPLKLCGVYVQYIDHPEGSYYVGECTVGASTAR